MNFNLFEFNKVSSVDVANFKQIAKEMKEKNNSMCKLNDYAAMKHIFLDEIVNVKCEPQNNFIYISSSDDEENKDSSKLQNPENPTNPNISDDLMPTITTEKDLVFTIKENLEMEECLSSYTLQVLNSLPLNKLETLFQLLKDELTLNQIKEFGNSLQDPKLCNQTAIQYFIRYLLLVQMYKEYSEEMQLVINKYFDKYRIIMTEELTKNIILQSDYGATLQYIPSLNFEVKTAIFENYVHSCDTLREEHIEVLFVLLNSQLSYNRLNKLAELMSKHANEFSSNKSFGKLIIEVIKLLGVNIVSLEQHFRHIIGVHKSIWKPRIQKEFNIHKQETSYSQIIC